jgi:hypothetical protein
MRRWTGCPFAVHDRRDKEADRMTKAEIVADIALQAKLTKAIAAKVFGAVIAAVKDALQKGEKVSITGFGTFSVTERKARSTLLSVIVILRERPRTWLNPQLLERSAK